MTSAERRWSPAATARRWPAATFFALAYVLSWSWWIPMAARGERVDFGSAATHVPGLFGPLLAAAIVELARGGRQALADLAKRALRWRVPVRFYGIAVGVPLLFLAVARLATSLLGGARFAAADLGRFGGLPEAGPLAMWLLLCACAAGEEVGWRGFALPHLQRTRSPLGATLLLALAWAGWHAPAFFVLQGYRDLGLAGVPGFAIGLACGAVVLTWLYNHTGGSVLLVTLWHGTFNLASATRAARGTTAAIVSTLVMAWGMSLAVRELRAQRRGEPSILGGGPSLK